MAILCYTIATQREAQLLPRPPSETASAGPHLWGRDWHVLASSCLNPGDIQSSKVNVDIEGSVFPPTPHVPLSVLRWAQTACTRSH